MLTTEVYSIWWCAFCAPLKIRPLKEALLDAKSRGWDVDKLGAAGQNVNPPTCPINYIKIDGQIYKREAGNCNRYTRLWRYVLSWLWCALWKCLPRRMWLWKMSPDVADKFSAVGAQLMEHNIINELQIRREDVTIVLYGRWLNHPSANTSLRLRKTCCQKFDF